MMLFSYILLQVIVTIVPYARIDSVRFLVCSAANREFALVAKAYSKLEEKAEKNVLFIRVPIDTAPKVFQYHNINTAPIITFLSSNDVLGKKVFHFDY